jgi:ABC-type nickel/cobalt efflux system permease component RcnA
MRRRRIALLVVVVTSIGMPAIALAQGGPFGIGTPEPGGAAWAGPLAPIFAQIATWQTEFYRQLTDALASLKESGGAIWLLAGVSFLYGIFHAAGPGHGKAVITAYLLASGETLKRGIAISFAAALVQAVTAVALVSILAGVLNVTSVTMTETTNLLEIASYALIALVGAWLLWSRLRPGRGHVHEHAGHRNDHARPRELGAAAAIEEDHHHSHHAPDPAAVAQPLTLRSAWAAVLAVGIRPCSGAVIVLVFALSQGLYAAGVASTFVMAAGTAITVSALASLAVFARDFAVRLTGGGQKLAVVLRLIEILAAGAVLLFGLLLLGGALSA